MTTSTIPTNARSWQGALTKALIIENPDPSLDEALLKLGIEPHRLPEPPDEDELVRILAEGQHHLIYKRSQVEINERVVLASPNLAAVMLCCIGDDSVDKAACAKHGVMVMNDPVSNGRSVAELVIGEVISLSRRLFDSAAEMGKSLWRKNNSGRYEVKGKRLGILGLGRIGRQVAQLADAFGMEVFFFDVSDMAREIGVTLGWRACASVNELFQISDVISVHVSAEDPRGRPNVNIIQEEHFQMFAQKAYKGPRLFINLARGFVIDPMVLRNAAKQGLITAAMTDVFPEEPSRAAPEAWANPYEGVSNIFATPHIGAATQEAQPRIARYVAHTTQMFSQLGVFRDCVFRPNVSIDIDQSISDHLLVVIHADVRGSRKAVSDAIFQSGANNLQSFHQDFPGYGIAYEVAALDRTLSPDQLQYLVTHTTELTGDPTAIRWLRTIDRPKP
jgi:D-3-phosphoglycerate dehydrogenase